MILYLECDIKESFIKAQHDELERVLDFLKERGVNFCKKPYPPELKNPKAHFERMYNLKLLREQKKNLEFILDL